MGGRVAYALTSPPTFCPIDHPFFLQICEESDITTDIFGITEFLFQLNIDNVNLFEACSYQLFAKSTAEY